MKKHLFLPVGGALAAMIAVSPAVGQDAGTILLSTDTVTIEDTTDSTDIPEAMGILSSITVATNAGVALYVTSITVVYGDGSTEETDVDAVLPAEGLTVETPLASSSNPVAQVTFEYNRALDGGAEAWLFLWGNRQ